MTQLRSLAHQIVDGSNYPYLKIAQHFKLDYGFVVCYADALRKVDNPTSSFTELNQTQEDAVAEANLLYSREGWDWDHFSMFREAMKEAAQDFELVKQGKIGPWAKSAA